MVLTADYLTVADTVLAPADGKQFTVSLWANLNGSTDGVKYDFVGTTNGHFIIRRSLNNKLLVLFRNIDSETICNISSTSPITSSSGLTHILVSVDLANTNVRIYINGVLETSVVTTNPIDEGINIENDIFYLGAGSAATSRFLGEIGQFYLTNTYIDMSAADNIRNFIDPNGNGVDLGQDGSIPTGSPPLIYLNNPTATWHNNLGARGNFTLNGSLSDGAGVPTQGLPNDLTLVSTAEITKITNPSDASILLFIEEVTGTVDLNNNLKAFVSRNGAVPSSVAGSEVTLSEVSDFENGKLYAGNHNISGQPAGSAMRWEIQTNSNISIKAHGVGLKWA